MSTQSAVGRQDIERLLPHARGWVFPDEVLEWERFRRISVVKYLDADDTFTKLHFNGRLDMYPGVLLIELAGQAAHLLSILSATPKSQEAAVQVLAACRATFLRPVRVGAAVVVNVIAEDLIRGISLFSAEVLQHDVLACRISLTGAPLIDRTSNK